MGLSSRRRASYDETIRMWNLNTGEEIDASRADGRRWTGAVGATTLHGRPVALTLAHDGGLRVLDLTTDPPTTTSPADQHAESVHDLAVTTIGDRPAAVIASRNSSDPVTIWDLSTGNALGDLPSKATGAVAAATVDGQPIAATTSHQTVRVWKLTTRRQVGSDLHFPKPVRGVAISADGHVIVCFDRDIAVFVNTPAPPEP
ncbi:WD40 repeat domain-containing protein [Nonomuraea deserti]|uniref:WD40 repeat domain-containing protein n=1 Tax=Nonomuraea deserti TaxID=1848322 RepID=A0A4V6PCJ5_9ACTN|nr:WD40 repeat domain-containing protein [Nonomuraea deserti]TDD01506.1 WD40 repeat domain-containing protein [Nonomuraea deserti]